MQSSYPLAIIISLVVAAAVYGAFSATPLTTVQESSENTVSPEEFERTVSQEYTHCRSRGDGVNCACFANKSGTILTSNAPRMRGMVYADKQDLARMQAERSC